MSYGWLSAINEFVKWILALARSDAIISDWTIARQNYSRSLHSHDLARPYRGSLIIYRCLTNLSALVLRMLCALALVKQLSSAKEGLSRLYVLI